MKILNWFVLLVFGFVGKAFANPACAVCTVAIAGSLTVAKKLGLDECVIGVWVGALLAMMGYWMMRFCEKRNWTFPLYRPILMLSSLSMAGFVYVKDLVYTPNVIGFLYVDYFLFSTLCGALTLIFGLHFYQWMKAKNGGHAHFPFEKVVVPILLVFILSSVFYFYPICDCETQVAGENLVVSFED